VIALQVTTSFRSGDVPFYDLSLMGGAYKMRGYYEGAIRDNALIDGQLEDTPRDTNLRFDFGFGPGGIHGFYINFAEAF
jgi:hypothetical protein